MKKAARQTRVARRLAALMLTIACTPGLVGCTPPSIVAARLNTDGTVDFLTCHSQEAVEEIVANVYIRRDESITADLDLMGDPPSAMEPGDILHFSEVPTDQSWDRLYVGVYGTGRGNSGRDYPSSLSAVIDRSSLEVGEWSWPLWTTDRCEPSDGT